MSAIRDVVRIDGIVEFFSKIEIRRTRLRTPSSSRSHQVQVIIAKPQRFELYFGGFGTLIMLPRVLRRANS